MLRRIATALIPIAVDRGRRAAAGARSAVWLADRANASSGLRDAPLGRRSSRSLGLAALAVLAAVSLRRRRTWLALVGFGGAAGGRPRRGVVRAAEPVRVDVQSAAAAAIRRRPRRVVRRAGRSGAGRFASTATPPRTRSGRWRTTTSSTIASAARRRSSPIERSVTPVWCGARRSTDATLTFRLVGINNQNFVMQDEQTGSWWQQVSGEAILGPLKGRRLTLLPFDQLTFAHVARARRRSGRVLAPATRHRRGEPLRAARTGSSGCTKTPAPRGCGAIAQLEPRTLVIGVEVRGASRAYPLAGISAVGRRARRDRRHRHRHRPRARRPIDARLRSTRRRRRARAVRESRRVAVPHGRCRHRQRVDFAGVAVSGPLSRPTARAPAVSGGGTGSTGRTYHPSTDVARRTSSDVTELAKGWQGWDEVRAVLRLGERADARAPRRAVLASGGARRPRARCSSSDAAPGRVTSPLARAGVDIVGVDRSAPMLDARGVMARGRSRCAATSARCRSRPAPSPWCSRRTASCSR